VPRSWGGREQEVVNSALSVPSVPGAQPNEPAGRDVPRLTHIHALFFYGWLLFFLKQTSLASSGAVARHRELGVAGVALAAGMFFVGTGMALSSIRRSEAAGFGDAALAFSAVSLTGIALFAVLFCIAIVNVKKPEIDKRPIPCGDGLSAFARNAFRRAAARPRRSPWRRRAGLIPRWGRAFRPVLTGLHSGD